MKTLVIVRHAKSSWENLSLDDFDRPLNERGKRDAPRMAKRIKEKDFTIDLMISSPAKRALSTCKRMAKILNYPADLVQTIRPMYHADEETILHVVQTINNAHDTVFLFGHNPGLTDFANQLTNNSIANIPTCGVMACQCAVNHWSEITWGMAKVLFYDFPKNKND